MSCSRCIHVLSTCCPVHDRFMPPRTAYATKLLRFTHRVALLYKLLYTRERPADSELEPSAPVDDLGVVAPFTTSVSFRTESWYWSLPGLSSLRMTRSASQRYTERQKKIRRTQEEERAVASPPPSRSFVGSMIRFARAYEFSPHHTGGVFVSCVFHSHHTSTFPSSLLLRSRHDSSTDDAAGARIRIGAAEGFFATGRISSGRLRISDRISSECGMARRARRRGMWIVTVSFHFAMCAFVSDTRLLETS